MFIDRRCLTVVLNKKLKQELKKCRYGSRLLQKEFITKYISTVSVCVRACVRKRTCVCVSVIARVRAYVCVSLCASLCVYNLCNIYSQKSISRTHEYELKKLK